MTTPKLILRFSLFGALLLPFLSLPAAQAGDPGPSSSLLQQVQQLQAQVNALQAQLAAVQSSLATVQGNTVLQLNGKLTLNTTDPTRPTAVFTGVNVQIVNGTGNTASANGLGNLLIGYDAVRSDSAHFCSDGAYSDENSCTGAGGTWAVSLKTGSHYLIIGDENNYSQWGGQVVGYRNTSNQQFASVSGGEFNTASGFASSVSGGDSNTASGSRSSVSGGFNNAASGAVSTVTGGEENAASGERSSVTGGQRNIASGTYSSVTGGYSNTASYLADSVSGGDGVTLGAPYMYSWQGGTYAWTYP